MKKYIRRIIYTISIISIVWIGLTLWVQLSNSDDEIIIGGTGGEPTVLIAYNPDPIYNLDEQLCVAFANGLATNGIKTRIITTDNTPPNIEYDIFVFCANTYNWAPDWGITSFINDIPSLDNKNCINITVGSGSTSRARQLLDESVVTRGANLMDSREFWLLKPNDDNRMEESNIDVAVDMAYNWGLVIGLKMK
jgi:flavorubredoxin